MKIKWKRLFVVIFVLGFMLLAGIATIVISYSSQLPKIITLKDYKPRLVSEVFDRNGKKIGEFYREKRILVPYEKIPKVLIHAFVAAEDSSFFSHGGINFIAIFRAALANLKAGRRVQGASTITQQVARSLLLTREKTYKRKIKEILLSRKMEANLSKEDILYLYLNQIFLGHGAYGIEMASQIYFRKPVNEITLGEAALLAGLPQAPSRYTPVYNPKQSKARQRYVLNRMADEGFITVEEADKAINENIKVYIRKNYTEIAPYYLESLRQILIDQVGEDKVLDEGLKVYTGLDLEKQLSAQKSMKEGLHDLDKRQGYRGPISSITEPTEVEEFLQKSKKELISEKTDERIIQPDGTFLNQKEWEELNKIKNTEDNLVLPDYLSLGQITKGIVTQVNDKLGYVMVSVADVSGVIDFETMDWARKPNPEQRYEFSKIKKPSEALKKGDVILVKIDSQNFVSKRLLAVFKKKELFEKAFEGKAQFSLEQEPIVQGALLSIDQDTEEIISMVGGYDFKTSKFNRAYQATRQTGSSFKSIVYAAALDKNYTPATPIMDAPIVYEEPTEDKELITGDDEGQVDENSSNTKIWKPTNHSKKFMGDMLFRNALIKSKNIPTIKIIEKIGVDWVAQYAQRLGIFSPLNMDFTLALGSSSVTLYEMTKVFSQFGRLGKRVKPLLIHKIADNKGETLVEKISFDIRFEKELNEINQKFETKRESYLALKNKYPQDFEHESKLTNTNGSELSPEVIKALRMPKLYFKDKDQLISPQTAYLITSLLKGVVNEGTGARARALARPVAGKTGTTNGYFDGWFVGFTRDIATGVWVGFDTEKSLGVGEVGGKVALPIWTDYMKEAHKNLASRDFSVPNDIIFANIDNKTGKLASAESESVVNQAFLQGTEPEVINGQAGDDDDEQDFYKQELND